MLKQIFIIGLCILLLSIFIRADPWDLSSLTYDNLEFDVDDQQTNPQDLFFNPGLSKMYIIGTSDDNIHQYTLNTPGDISSASYDNIVYNILSKDNGANGLFINDTGTMLWFVGLGNDLVHQFTLSDPWNLSTIVDDYINYSVKTQAGSPTDLFFSKSGDKLFILSSSLDEIYQYTLTDPWNISSAGYDSIKFSVYAQDGTPTDMFFNDSGNKMYMVGSANDLIHQYTLSDPWNLSSISYDKVNISIVAQEATASGIFFNETGGSMYLIGRGTDFVYQYSLPVAPPDTCTYGGTGNWEITISDNCEITDDTDLSSDKLIITGDNGKLSIQSEIKANQIHIQPDDFDGDFEIEIISGGSLVATT